MLKFHHILLIVLFGLLITNSIKAQAPLGELRDIYIMENLDSIQTKRTYGDFWFGINFGGNHTWYTGNMYLPTRLAGIYDTVYKDPITGKLTNTDSVTNPRDGSPGAFVNPQLKFKGGTGFGYQYGFMAEYLPKNEYFGFILRFNYREYRQYNSTNSQDTWDSTYSNKSSFKYLTISPLIRYNSTWLTGLYFTGGINYESFVSTLTRRHQEIKEDAAVGLITQNDTLQFSEVKNRIGFQIGAGIDIFVADIVDWGPLKFWRAQFSPNVNFTFLGGDVLGKQKTSAISIPDLKAYTFNLGFSLKMSWDDVKIDTLKFDPTKSQNVQISASTNDNKGAGFKGFKQNQLQETNNLNFNSESKVKAQISEEAVLNKPVKKPDNKSDSTKAVEEEPTEKINFGQAYSLGYSPSTNTELTKEMKSYYTSIAKKFKESKNLELRIVTHSDNAGTTAEKEKRSQERGEAAKRFLMSKGVPLKSIFITNKKDLEPIADNRTEEGRKKNRRVVITLVKK